MGSESTLTSKGHTTIPKEIRDSLGMKTGDRMTFTLFPDGTVLLRVKNRSVMDLAGRLHRKGRKAVPDEGPFALIGARHLACACPTTASFDGEALLRNSRLVYGVGQE